MDNEDNILRDISLKDLIDISVFQGLTESFSQLTGVPTAILDLEGNILVAAGWRKICEKFHRKNPVTAKRCLESDTRLAGRLAKGEEYNLYKCLNGLVDVAVPIIIDNAHMGNLFGGQFFLEPPDPDFFSRQAEEFGFNRTEYLAALSEVPVLSEKRVKQVMKSLTDLTVIVANTGIEKMKNIQLNRDLDQRIQDQTARLQNEIQHRKKAEGELQASKQMETGEVPISLPDGETGTLELFSFPIGNDRDEITSIVEYARDITQRKHIQNALQKSEGFLRSLIRSIPDLVWLKNPEGVYISCNSRFERFFGAEEKAIVGKTDYDFMDKAPADFFRMHDRAAIAKGASSINEEEVTFADDGHREILETIKTPMYGNDGQLIGVLGIGRDITERKRMEADLKRHIEFQKLVSGISSELAGTSAGDLDSTIVRALKSVGNFTKADRAYVFQYRKGGVLVDNTHEWCAPGIDPQIEFLRDIRLEEKAPWHAELMKRGETFHTPDVAALPAQARKDCLFFQSLKIKSLIVIPMETAGDLIGFLGFDAVHAPRTWDKDDQNILRFLGETIGHVIKRKRAEEALRESEARWQFALEGAGDGVWDWNAVTNRVYFSPRWKSMLGYDESDIGDTLDEWESRVHPDDKAATMTEIERHLKGETPVYVSEHRLHCKDGHNKWILDRGKVVEWTEDGKPLRVIGTHTDISDAKRHQAEHERLIHELQEALAKVKQLSGLLPICSYCKKIRDDKGYWKQIESYIGEHSEAEFSHSICQDCLKKHYPGFVKPED